MDIYFGIRATGNNLHIGHVITLLNMFDYVTNNNINKINILLAEIHSELSVITESEISNNSIILAKKIHALYKTYLMYNNKNINKNINKLIFIFQNEISIRNYHLSITYKYLPLILASKLLKNPIFKNNKNKSLGFLIYPILQTFDILLYHNNLKMTTVFLGGDQIANINIMKDILKKINIKNVKFNISKNVICGTDGKVKMSKSLNNFINFDDIDNMKKYITKHNTGEIDSCNLYNNILIHLFKYFNIEDVICKSGNCFNCKQYAIDKLLIIIKIYNSNFNDDFDTKLNTVNECDLINNYNHLLKKINNTRCNINEDC
jgi:tryptophanyl-tRNA synthetase